MFELTLRFDCSVSGAAWQLQRLTGHNDIHEFPELHGDSPYRFSMRGIPLNFETAFTAIA